MIIKNISAHIKDLNVRRHRSSNSSYNLWNNNFQKVKELKNRLRLSKNYTYIVIAVLVIAIAFLLGSRFNEPGIISTTEGKIEAPAPIATQTLNRTFKFPLFDDKSKEVSKIDFVIESANLQDAFIYQGKLAKAVKGRTFFILNLKITNPYSKTIEINAKDYVRVKVNNSSEQLAPEIHNDPVQIQAKSTKYTRIGVPINETDKNLTLLVGELEGEKETIELTLEE